MQITQALSIKQPWAWLICNGFKDVENRNWIRMTKFRGDFLVHASKQMDMGAYLKFRREGIIPDRSEIKLGGIVGKARVVDAVGPGTIIRSSWAEPDALCRLILDEQRPLPFVPCDGMLGFWKVPSDVLAILGI